MTLPMLVACGVVGFSCASSITGISMSLIRTFVFSGGCTTCFSCDIPGVVMALDGMRSSAVLSWFWSFFSVKTQWVLVGVTR